MLKREDIKDELANCILVALSNFAVLPDWHSEFYPVLHTAYQIIDKSSPALKLQALKLLINLSCNEDMVPSLLAAQVSNLLKIIFLIGRFFKLSMIYYLRIFVALLFQAPRKLIYHLDESVNEDLLLRVVTLLSNLTQAAKSMQLDPTLDLPAEDKAASPETM